MVVTEGDGGRWLDVVVVVQEDRDCRRRIKGRGGDGGSDRNYGKRV